MKRVFTAIGISIVLIALCITGYAVVSNKMNDFDSKINILQNADKQTAYATAEATEKDFHKSETLLAFFVNHQKLDEMKVSLARMRCYAQNEDMLYLKSECAQIQIIIEDILDDQRFCMHSMF